MAVFRLEDIARRIVPLVQNKAATALDSKTSIDAVRDLITAIPIEICREYYGVQIADAGEFARWTFAISRWLFDAPDPSIYREFALGAARLLNDAIDTSIEATRTHGVQGPDTILKRLLIDAGLDAVTTRVIVAGMIIGFVPTNTVAGSKILQQLLDHPEFLVPTRNAALANDDDLLERCLFEAMRFDPLVREPLRRCTQDYVLAKGTPRQTLFKKGQMIVAVTRSAMMDAERIDKPRLFDPNRPAHDSMLFGYGLHRCIGAPIAQAQITHTLKPLLRKAQLRRARKARACDALGPFQEHLDVLFADEPQPVRST
jgi:cytochrome P450